MTDKTTLEETVRSPIDGTEAIRLATVGANWRTTAGDMIAALSGRNAATMAALRAIPSPVNGSTAYLNGFYAAGDGGEGTFTFNGASNAVDDNGVVIAPTVGAGRWIRNTYSSLPNIRWWGAHCDYNNGFGTDDYPAFLAARNWAHSVRGAKIKLPRGVKIALATTFVNPYDHIMFDGDSTGTLWTTGDQEGSTTITSIFWLGSVGGEMFAWRPNPGTGSRSLLGGGLSGIALYGGPNGTPRASVALHVSSICNSVWTDIYVRGTTAAGVVFDAYSATDPAQNLVTCRNNFLRDIHIHQDASGGTTGGGFTFGGYDDGITAGNFCFNTCINLMAYISNAGMAAIRMSGTDNNKWINCDANNSAGGGEGFLLEMSTAGGRSYNTNTECFYGISYTKFHAKTGVSMCCIYGYDNGNGIPAPVMDDGGGIQWINARGECSLDNISMGTPNVSGKGVLAIKSSVIPDTSWSGVGQLYTESGVLKYRGSNGTITTLANA